MTETEQLTQAQQLTDELAALYQRYQADCDALEASETLLSRLRGWLGGGKKAANDPIHLAFYQSVQQQCELLTEALAALAPANPEAAHRCALRSVTLILDPVPDAQRDLCGRMRLASEPLSAPLLRWLTAEELQVFRVRFLAVYPKRRMFPTQQALLRELDAQLKRKGL